MPLSSSGSDFEQRQMYLASPESPLNCQALSLHLPYSSGSQSSRSKPSYLPPPISPSSPDQDGTYYQKTGSHRQFATSPPLLSGNSGKQNTLNMQIRSRDNPGTRLLYGSPGDLSEPLQSPRQLGSDVNSYLDAPSDDLSSSAQDSPATMSLVMSSPGVARRAKAHVPSACVNCKRKHLACETRRPCNRCLRAGKEVSFLVL